ncbi:MAG: glycosyltransferase [Rhodoferax sp.]|nr:glycosyltransferase [Rhodoferax sp.]
MNATYSALWNMRKAKAARSLEKLLFNRQLRSETVAMRGPVIARAEFGLSKPLQHEGDAVCLASTDPVVRQGWLLKKQVEQEFRGMYAARTDERILIQVPPPAYSPAGYSLFTNLAESLDFIGVPTQILGWDDDTATSLDSFSPTVLLTSDHHSYLAKIDWTAITRYKTAKRLRVGLTASLAEYDNTPLPERLAWSAKNGVDFYYTFRDEGYVTTRDGYQQFFEAGYPMLYLPFGANILHYYPVAGFERDLDYAIIATRKSEHISYLKYIARQHIGFIDGPGWKHVRDFRFNRARDRYIYARAKVGLNVHLPEQIDWACEVNERTYQLAACGVPQLIDHPKLLDSLFSQSSLYVASGPAHYLHLFKNIMDQPEEAVQRALLAQQEVFSRHTTFHRADSFMRQLVGTPWLARHTHLE